MCFVAFETLCRVTRISCGVKLGSAVRCMSWVCMSARVTIYYVYRHAALTSKCLVTFELAVPTRLAWNLGEDCDEKGSYRHIEQIQWEFHCQLLKKCGHSTCKKTINKTELLDSWARSHYNFLDTLRFHPLAHTHPEPQEQTWSSELGLHRLQIWTRLLTTLLQVLCLSDFRWSADSPRQECHGGSAKAAGLSFFQHM